jgi:hypothetical protein
MIVIENFDSMVTLQISVRKVLCSNLLPDTDFVAEIFLVFLGTLRQISR